MKIDHRKDDGGLASRKLWMAVLTSVLITACALLSTQIPPLVALFPTISGALTGVLALYLGANVTMRHVQQKGAIALQSVTQAQNDSEPEEPAPAPAPSPTDAPKA